MVYRGYAAGLRLEVFLGSQVTAIKPELARGSVRFRRHGTHIVAAILKYHCGDWGGAMAVFAGQLWLLSDLRAGVLPKRNFHHVRVEPE